MKVLVTGGAGFIGTHLVQELLACGYSVTVLDNFLPQIHGNRRHLKPEIAPHVRLVVGDAADPEVMAEALTGAESVLHLAAETGTGQSMYEVSRYGRTNVGGSAALYEALAKPSMRSIRKIVVASSRAIYGEGAYECQKDGVVYPESRPREDKLSGNFDPLCPACGMECSMIPTPETAPLRPSSFYGLTKQMQEQTAILFGRTLGVSTFALRYQNVYGPGQSLQNPYTGILAIFANLARAGQTIRIFEDGAESRDFVHVEDVVQATKACLESEEEGCCSLNVGSSEGTSVLEVATQISNYFGRSAIEITGEFRDGDIRHGMADLTRIREVLGYKPRWSFREGLRSFLDWATESPPAVTGYKESLAELKERGLFHAQN